MAEVRPARLDDTVAISALFQAEIPVWQRLDAQGHVESLPHAQLTIYERWMHGGAWLSIETAVLHLSRLLQGAGLAFVATEGDAVVAYIEAYAGDEPSPLKQHIHLARWVGETEALNLLVRHLLTIGAPVTVSIADHVPPVFEPYRLKSVTEVQRYHVMARTGQGFYKVNEHLNSSAAQIVGWGMPIGRTESASQHWETLWNRVWDIIPEIRARRLHRLSMSASGHEAFICCQQQLFNPRNADIYCWSPKPLSAPLLTAIRDWAHRQDYRTLSMIITPTTASILGADAEPDPYMRQVYYITSP